MTWSPDSSTTGGAITGFTAPTFTLVDSKALVVNAVKKVVSAISTMGSAVANSATLPFFAEFTIPAQLKALPPANPLSGLRGTPPTNQYKLVVVKGGYAAAGVPVKAIARLTIDVPAGMDTYGADDVKALISFLVGLLNEESNDLAETCVTGVMA